MITKYVTWMDKSYPQNYLIQRPVHGSVLMAFYSFLFVIIYKPFDLNPSGRLSFEATMSLYVLAMILPHILLVYVLRRIPLFSSPDQWTVRKEFLAILLILGGLSVFIYGFGFLMEDPVNRFNLDTFMGSCKIVFLTCAILYGFLAFINFRALGAVPVNTDSNEQIVQIKSKLKGETLTFSVKDLVYVESDGNYVVFHLLQDGQTRKEVIRNSISEVEQMLNGIPFIVRTHRAFIVNMMKINEYNGNSSGYRLQLEGTSEEIPVSRSNIEKFDRLYLSNR